MKENDHPLTDEERRKYLRWGRESMTSDPLGTRRWPREPSPPKLAPVDTARMLLQECTVALLLDEQGKERPDANTQLLGRIQEFLRNTGG